MLTLSSTENSSVLSTSPPKPVPLGSDPRRPNPTRGRDHPSARRGNSAGTDYVAHESRLAKTVPFRLGAASPNATLASALSTDLCCPLIGARPRRPRFAASLTILGR